LPPPWCLATGCSWFGSKKTDEYKSAARPAKPLEVPPELTVAHDRGAFRHPRSAHADHRIRAKSASAPRTGRPAGRPSASAVLPKIEGARLGALRRPALARS
jgi:uncharacterized lipoprotein